VRAFVTQKGRGNCELPPTKRMTSHASAAGDSQPWSLSGLIGLKTLREKGTGRGHRWRWYVVYMLIRGESSTGPKAK